MVERDEDGALLLFRRPDALLAHGNSTVQVRA